MTLTVPITALLTTADSTQPHPHVLSPLAGYALKAVLWSGGEMEAEAGAGRQAAARLWSGLIRGIRSE